MAFSLPSTVQDLVDAILNRAPINFVERADFIEWLTDNTPTVGTLVSAAGVSYEYDGASTDDDELDGWKVLGGSVLSLAELRTAAAAFNGGDGARLTAPDIALVGDSGQASWSASPAIVGLRPENFILSTALLGTTSEIASDFEGRLKQAIDDCAANDWKLRLDAPADGTPFEYPYIYHEYSGNLHLIGDPRAEFYGTTGFQVFDTDGTNGPFTITDWSYRGKDTESYSAMYVDSSGNETGLEVETDIIESGSGPYSFTLQSGTPAVDYPAGGYIVISSAKSSLWLVGTAGAGDSLILDGDFKINIGRGGYVLAQATRTGFSIKEVDDVQIKGLVHTYGSAGSGPDVAPQLRRGDSGMSINNVAKLSVTGEIRGDYINDLVLYMTGGGSSGDSDNPEQTFINYISGINPRSGFKTVRQTRGTHVNCIDLVDNHGGFSHGLTNTLEPGGLITIGVLKGRRVRRNLASIADTDGGISIGAVMCEDFGFEADGVTEVSGSAPVLLSDTQGVHIGHLDVRLRDWSAPTGRGAIQLSGDNNYGNRVTSGYIEGLDYAVRETGTTTNDIGNDFNLTVKDVADPLDLHSDSRATYDITVLSESGGTVSAPRRLVRKYFEEAWTTDSGGTTAAHLFLVGESEPTHNIEEASFLFDGGRRLALSAELSVTGGNWTHSSTGQLRILLPYGFTGAALSGQDQLIPAFAWFGIDLGAALSSDDVEITGVVPDGESYIYFRYYDHANQSGGAITGSHCPSGTALRVTVNGEIMAAQS